MDNHKYQWACYRMIRKINIWDISEVASMWLSLMKEMTGTLCDKEKFALELVVNLYRNDYVCLIAEKGDIVVGFIISSIKEETGICDHIYIKKDFRNEGIDDELIKESIGMMKTIGVKKVEFTTTPRLAMFWERKGYKVMKVIMEKEV